MAELRQINWSGITGDKFQGFCNALLSFEVSKRLFLLGPLDATRERVVYIQEFMIGWDRKWRFQHKFHAEERAASRVKQDMEEEVDKIEEGDHFILLTNVKLDPAQREKVSWITKK